MDRSGPAKRRRQGVAALVVGAALVAAAAQGTSAHADEPYPTTAVPTAPSMPWGGSTVPQQPVYQPPSVPWQPYPPTTPNVPPAPVAYPELGGQGGKDPWFPPGARSGVFQKVNLTGTYLPQFEQDGLGLSELQLDVVFGLPLLTRDTPLLVTPFYGVHFTDGPIAPDVPPRLHDAAVKFEHIRPLSDEWLVLLETTLGEFADDHSFDASDAFRVTGGGVVVYRPTNAWKWVFGAQFVDRAETDVLPVAGFVYTPNDDVEYRLVFPEPRVSWRLPSTDVPGKDERWAYIGAEYGGGRWAVTRTTGAADELDITEYRLFIGYERKIVGGLSRRIELGYVFGRDLQFTSTPGEVSLDDTIMLRAGLTY